LQAPCFVFTKRGNAKPGFGRAFLLAFIDAMSGITAIRALHLYKNQTTSLQRIPISAIRICNPTSAKE
jgi:hypothetical protein